MKEVADKLAALAQSRQDLSDSGGNNGLRPALFIDNLSDIFAPKMGTPAEGQTSGNITAAESALSLQTFTASFFKSEKSTDQISTLSNDLNKHSDLTAKFSLNTGISYANSDKRLYDDATSNPTTKLLYTDDKLYISAQSIRSDPYNWELTGKIVSIADLQNAFLVISLGYSNITAIKSFKIKNIILNVTGRIFEVKSNDSAQLSGKSREPRYVYRFPEKESAFPISKRRVVCGDFPSAQ
jgi:hypothetical protein